MVLQSSKKKCYCFLHMGMTGRISSQDSILKLESLHGDDKYPPPHTHLIMRVDGYEVAYSDTRRFGGIALSETLAALDDLAVDALALQEMNPDMAADLFVKKKRGIKSILLDQKDAVSGVGNWVADEVLYQCEIHPDQSFLTNQESKLLVHVLPCILNKAVDCLHKDKPYPKEWIFNMRWEKKRKTNLNDFKGRTISFIISGGRSSAIVKSVQRLYKRSQSNEGTEISNDIILSNEYPQTSSRQKTQHI